MRRKLFLFWILYSTLSLTIIHLCKRREIFDNHITNGSSSPISTLLHIIIHLFDVDENRSSHTKLGKSHPTQMNNHDHLLVIKEYIVYSKVEGFDFIDEQYLHDKYMKRIDPMILIIYRAQIQRKFLNHPIKKSSHVR